MVLRSSKKTTLKSKVKVRKKTCISCKFRGLQPKTRTKRGYPGLD